jgi:ParB family chromosome partitioning protein
MGVKREKIHFASVEELLGAPALTGEGTEEIKIEDIYPFPNHPFKVVDDEKMEDLVKSISLNGVLTPVIVRSDKKGKYEMISGHRRLHAAGLAGLKVVPAVVKELDDDEAVIAMVDSNVQREEVLPSERAFSLKMKMEHMKHQGKRTDLTSDQNGPTLSSWKIGEDIGISGTQVKRYIRLTELIPELLELVDSKRIGFTMAVDISFFDKDIQTWLYEYFKQNGFLKPVQIEALKNCDNIENMTQFVMNQRLNEALPETNKSKKVTFSERKLDKYFPPHYSAKQREMVIISLLEKWQEENN